MRIALIDPFFDTSHAKWARGLQNHSRHEIRLYFRKAHYWKWQMVGGTFELARKIGKEIEHYDLIIATDMVDLPCFFGYLHKFKLPPALLYFHENQITYPWSPEDQDKVNKRDHHYGFMNVRSAWLADRVAFNSEYHKNSFLTAMPDFCNQFPENIFLNSLEAIKAKSEVMGIGIESKGSTEVSKRQTSPVFIWNHRWEYDKAPEVFFNTLIELKKDNIDFGIIVLGKSYNNQPAIFDKARSELNDHIVHWGYTQSEEEYQNLLSRANILLVTAIQDFFGISTVEAIVAGCYPILPNRLAYAEHIPDSHSDQAIYDGDEEMMILVKKVINEKRFLDTSVYVQYLKKYSWSKLADEYDQLFENMLS